MERLVVRFKAEEQVNMWKTANIAARVAGFGEAFGLFVDGVFDQQRMVHFSTASELNVPEIGRKIMSIYGGYEPPLCLLQKCREFFGKITVLEEQVIFPKSVPYSFSWYDESESRCGCSGNMQLQKVVEGEAFYEAKDVLFRGRRTNITARYKREGDTLVRAV